MSTTSVIQGELTEVCIDKDFTVNNDLSGFYAENIANDKEREIATVHKVFLNLSHKCMILII